MLALSVPREGRGTRWTKDEGGRLVRNMDEADMVSGDNGGYVYLESE